MRCCVVKSYQLGLSFPADHSSSKRVFSFIPAGGYVVEKTSDFGIFFSKKISASRELVPGSLGVCQEDNFQSSCGATQGFLLGGHADDQILFIMIDGKQYL